MPICNVRGALETVEISASHFRRSGSPLVSFACKFVPKPANKREVDSGAATTAKGPTYDDKTAYELAAQGFSRLRLPEGLEAWARSSHTIAKMG